MQARRTFAVALVLIALVPITALQAQENLGRVADVSVAFNCTGSTQLVNGNATDCMVIVSYAAPLPDVALPSPEFPPSFTGKVVVKGSNTTFSVTNSVTVPMGGTSAPIPLTLQCQPSGTRGTVQRLATPPIDSHHGSRQCSSKVIPNPPCPPCGGKFKPACPGWCGGSSTIAVCVDDTLHIGATFSNERMVKNSGTLNFLCIPSVGPTRGTF